MTNTTSPRPPFPVDSSVAPSPLRAPPFATLPDQPDRSARIGRDSRLEASGSPNGTNIEGGYTEHLDRRLRDSDAKVGASGKPPRRPTEQAVEEMCRFIVDNFGEELTLRRVAAVVGLSPFHACRMFKRVTGHTVHGYLLNVRLRAALRMLADTPLRIVDIAIQTGFASHAHLTSTFTRAFEIGPAAARRVLRSGDYSRYGKIVEAMGRPQG